MTEIASAIERIQRVAEPKGGLRRLAQEAAVPYTTVHSFQKRGWSNKNVEVIEKLAAAAERIETEDHHTHSEGRFKADIPHGVAATEPEAEA